MPYCHSESFPTIVTLADFRHDDPNCPSACWGKAEGSHELAPGCIRLKLPVRVFGVILGWNVVGGLAVGRVDGKGV